MLPPSSDLIWGYFWRGILFGVIGGLVLIVAIVFWDQKYRGGLLLVKPIGLLYFLAGAELGVALIGGLVFAGLEALGHFQQQIEEPNSPK